MDVEFEEVTLKVRENVWSIRGKIFVHHSVSSCSLMIESITAFSTFLLAELKSRLLMGSSSLIL